MAAAHLSRRQCSEIDQYGDCINGGNSPWYSYGRWIVLGAIILFAFLLFLSCSCLTARRRRRQGLNPYRGTGWAAGVPPPGHAPAQYTGAPGAQPYYGNNATAPPYSPPVNQGYNYNQQAGYGSNQGYFGGQQTGVELQQPEGAYTRGGENVYAAPPGAPPGKKETGDGIVR